MPAKKRLMLWTGDGPLNAVDGVVRDLKVEIESTISEAEDDPAFLNYAVAYLRCLAGILREVGGEHLVADCIPGWKSKTLGIYDRMKFATKGAEEVKKDRKYLVSIFADLSRLCR